MKTVLFSLFFLLQVCLGAKVYDCFPFWKEFEVLQIRLEELYDEVDYFVLVEGTKTFTGDPKPLYFAENAHLFEKYRDKIIHIVVEDYPPVTGDLDKDFWAREIHQHNASLRGLTNCHPDDIIFLSDVDEVIRGETIRKVKSYFANKHPKKYLLEKRKGVVKPNVVALDMPNFSFQLNRTATTRWTGPAKAVPYWVLSILTPDNIHLLHHTNLDLYTLWDAGWHFNTMGLLEMAIAKWKCHNPNFSYDQEGLRKSYEECKSRHIPVPVDDSFPKYVRDNLEYYRSIGWIADY